MENDFKPQQVNQAPNTDNTISANKSFYQANKFYISAIIAAVVIIGVLAFFAFRPSPAPKLKEANVEVQVLAPETLPSGSEAVYRIVLRNNEDRMQLTSLELELAYSEGLAFVESSPKAKNISGSLFGVPDLFPGQNATVIVKAKASGDINSEKKLFAKLHYKYSNFNSSFVKESSHVLRLTASNVALELDGPKETNSAQLIIYTISYKNSSNDTIKNARLKLNYPSGFNFGSSEPQASLGGNIWNIGDLQQGAEGKITLQGSFASSQPGESKTLQAEFQILGNNGEYFIQNTREIVTVITSSPLLVSLENLDQFDAKVAAPGDTLNFAVRYQNNAAVAATGVNIAVNLDSKALDLSSLQAQNAQLSGNTISWNAAGVPDLENLNPSESGILNFYVRVKNPATKDSSKNLSVIISAKIKSNEYSTFLPGGSVNLKISSPAQIQASLEYLSGSLPPKVGTQTKYKAILKLSNSSNDLTASELSCFLPAAFGVFDIQNVGQAERSNVEFDESTGKLTWRVGVLGAHAGKFSPARILEFTVAANPSPADAGNSLTLLRNIKFYAKDSFTEEAVNLSTEDLTTASLSGQNGYSSGSVVP